MPVANVRGGWDGGMLPGVSARPDGAAEGQAETRVERHGVGVRDRQERTGRPDASYEAATLRR